MIYLHKIIPILLLPIGLTILLVLTGLILHRKVLCWLGITVFWLAGTPFVADFAMRTAEGWQMRKLIDTLPEANAIVVLSGMLTLAPGNPPVSEWGDAADRFFAGVELYRADKAPLLIFTGGWVPWQPHAQPEGRVLARYATDKGIPQANLLITDEVVNTEEEAFAIADLLGQNKGEGTKSRVLLVTSAFHMRRAKLLFERAGLEVVSFPVDFRVPARRKLSLLDFLPDVRSLDQTETALREFYGILFYQIKW
ncbi:MAG: YdcF family protein [wastewater metagenome]|nr:YdcF family protein [Candidatus Loosdrechtia aerotolerans]